MNEKLRNIVTASTFAAITTLATMVIKVPTFGTNGYVNIGDAAVLLSAWLLGNPYGAIAAGLGSAFADLLSGYPAYIPGTAIIKFAMAIVCAAIYKSLKNRFPKTIVYIVSSIVAEALMIIGYFLYSSIYHRKRCRRDGKKSNYVLYFLGTEYFKKTSKGKCCKDIY